MAVMPLLIYDALEAIQYAQAILDFTILAQYVLHDNKTFRYIEHALYRLENIKIAFEYNWPIISKLCQPTFNYFKFHAINHFVQYIQDYGSTVNYDIAHSKTVYKHILNHSTIEWTKRSTTYEFGNIMYVIPI